MMDGGYYNPQLNLQKEFIYSHNIVQLFQKHKVPYPSFDHLTVDIDLNTFAVALAVLRGGFRPRSLTVEFNRNFAWSDSGYAVLDVPDEQWVYPDACEGGCDNPPFTGEQQKHDWQLRACEVRRTAAFPSVVMSTALLDVS
jgi:hypothetical protein